MLDINEQLIGVWVSDPKDTDNIDEYGCITMEFTKDGKLQYTIEQRDKKQKIFIIYKIEGNILITDQPSHPREEKTKFEVKDNNLTLYFRGRKSKYIRK